MLTRFLSNEISFFSNFPYFVLMRFCFRELTSAQPCSYAIEIGRNDCRTFVTFPSDISDLTVPRTIISVPTYPAVNLCEM